jgi:ribosomal protein L11 methyltransferase
VSRPATQRRRRSSSARWAEDWTAASRAALPVRSGVLCCTAAKARAAPNEIGIEIEAALAFGTGHHGTTQGCLLAIERIEAGVISRAVRREPESISAAVVISPGPSSSRRNADRRNRARRRKIRHRHGTGALAIAAARFRRPVVACDIDPVAVETARANAQANRAGAFVRIVRWTEPTRLRSAPARPMIWCSPISCSGR